ncbi:MAG TPA: hypothetical protein PLE19_23060 [Planctomycetota bacterium]|nr:hypothetical protein [Planctomycetota bacterium]HRT96563.1 hypothetical protein [Planctomycetota bacterium]
MSVQELDLVATFLDVGHGDAIVLRFREGHQVRTVVVDGGGPAHAGRLLSYLQRCGTEVVDLMVATHVDRHHIAGLLPVAEAEQIKIECFLGPACESTQPSVAGLRLPDERAYQRLFSRIHSRVRPERILSPVRGMPLPPLFGEATITVLHPGTTNLLRAAPQDAPARRPQDLVVEQNELSLVLHIEAHGIRLLLGGDAQATFWTAAAAERTMSRYLDVNILKVPHYGRPTGLPAALALSGAVCTEYAVFSLSAKLDKVPAPDLVRAFRETPTEVLCTEHAVHPPFCANPYCHAAVSGQDIVFCRCRGDSSYSTSAEHCPASAEPA